MSSVLMDTLCTGYVKKEKEKFLLEKVFSKINTLFSRQTNPTSENQTGLYTRYIIVPKEDGGFCPILVWANSITLLWFHNTDLKACVHTEKHIGFYPLSTSCVFSVFLELILPHLVMYNQLMLHSTAFCFPRWT